MTFLDAKSSASFQTVIAPKRWPIAKVGAPKMPSFAQQSLAATEGRRPRFWHSK
jgi:hypothetical protein